MVMDRRTALAVLSYCLAGSGVGCKEGPTTGTGDQRRDDLLKFNATFTLRENELLLSYEVQNRSTTDIYLDTPIGSDGPGYEISPDVIFVHLDAWTKTVRLYKDIGDPDGAYSFSTPVRAGGTFKEEVHVPFPIKPFPPLGIREPPWDAWPNTYRRVQFSLVYRWRTEGMTDKTEVLRGVTITLTRGAPGGRLRQKEDYGSFETEQVRMNLPVLEWTVEPMSHQPIEE
jgi:hypothetical protein